MATNYGYKSIDGWIKIYQHKTSGGYWSNSDNWAEVLNSNPTNPNSEKYSQLYKVNDSMRIGNEFILKLVYPEGNITNIWAQTHNPLENAPTGSTVPGFRSISIDSLANSFGGMSRSDGGSAFLDCNPLGTNWYYPIGQLSAWNNGIPAYTSTGVPTCEFWIKIRN